MNSPVINLNRDDFPDGSKVEVPYSPISFTELLQTLKPGLSEEEIESITEVEFHAVGIKLNGIDIDSMSSETPKEFVAKKYPVPLDEIEIEDIAHWLKSNSEFRGRNEKVSRIKAIRALSGCSLKQAMNECEERFKIDNGSTPRYEGW